MAEHARLLIEGIETKNILIGERDEAFRLWGLLVDFFHQTHVVVVKQAGLDTHAYSFGSIYELLYGSWGDFVRKDSLKGITQNTYQMIAPLLMQHPELGGELADMEWDRKKSPKVSYGMCPGVGGDDYVRDTKAWQDKRAKYYASHQGEYRWQESDDDFLPNRLWSDKILKDEIEKHGCLKMYEKEENDKNKNALAAAFHDGVVKKKGCELAAYIEEVGGRVCKANYYQYESDLSAKEQLAAKGRSLRKIYSILNRNGKKQYISLDLRHGMMEFHDEKGTHLGEFRFTGVKNSEAESSHDLQTLK